jgi:hypothetical protein
MTHSFLRILASINRVLTTTNGFLFGILGQFSPLHSRRGKPLRIPLPVNVLLLVTLVVVLVLLFRAYGYFDKQPAGPVFN